MGRRTRQRSYRLTRPRDPELAARVAAIEAARDRLSRIKVASVVGGGVALAALAGTIALASGGGPGPTPSMSAATDIFGQAANPAAASTDAGSSSDQAAQPTSPDIVSAPS